VVQAAPGEDRSTALALVNTWRLTAGGPVDDLATPESAAAWLGAHGLSVDGPDALPGGLADLRTAVRELLAAVAEGRVPPGNAVAAVNAAARADAAAPQLAWRESTPVREWFAARPGSVEAAVAALARDAIEVAAGELGALVRPCEAHGCVRYFLREHARRRWCSTTCGDRVRAARHQRLVVEQREGSR
jgi:predicted RNA-binding Zn ribbon-like protein